MEWSEIDLAAAEWIIPAERSKNGLPHVVALPQMAVQLLDQMPRWQGGGYVLTLSSGERPITKFSDIKSRTDRLVELDPWVFHELRRTFRTGLSRLKIQRAVAEAVLNHAPPGLVGVYDIYGFAAEKREALDLWASYLRDLIQEPPDNLVKLGETA